METNFIRAVELLINEHERGYANHKWDPGGRTIYGISEAAHPDLWRNGPPPREKCVERYHSHYWVKARCDLLPWIIAFPVFDGAVMHDPVDSVLMLQIALGNVKVDGFMGPKTAAAVAAVDKKELLADYLSRRTVHMAKLPHWLNAGRGWSRRLFLVQQQALEV